MNIFCFLLTQPKIGRVEINSDGRTARFLVKNPSEALDDVEPRDQEFSYQVQKFPTDDSGSGRAVRSAMIYLFDGDDCYDEKPIEYQKLKATDERFVNL